MKKIQLYKFKNLLSKIEFIKEKITINNSIIVGFGLFCLYIIYLSIPSFYNQKLVKDKIKLEINRIYNSDSVSFEKFNYSIFPRPHYKINNVIIYKEKTNKLAEIKKISLQISQKNFFIKNNIKIKKIQIIGGNFYLNYKSYIDLKNYIKSKKIQYIQIKKGNFFFVDNNFTTIAIAVINNINLKYNKNKNLNEFFYKGQIYNLPFKIKYNFDLYKKEADLILNFKKINLNFKNKSRYYQSNKFINEIQFLRTKFNSLINYDKENKAYIIKSKDSIIQQTEIDYLGKVNFDPFFFSFKFNIDKIDQKKLFFLNYFFEKFISNYLVNNPYINGDLEINIKNIKKHNLFTDSKIKVNINRGEFDLSNTIIRMGSVGELKILSNKIINQNNKIELLFNASVKIENQKKIFKKFLIPKKNRKKIKNIILNIKLIPSSNEVLFGDFYIESNKFNFLKDEDISIDSWQEFRNLVNDLYLNYKG
tara:strand:- start:482 stop:1912 length:1431 start_codon:yes stop_codon:yes gene_type:complete